MTPEEIRDLVSAVESGVVQAGGRAGSLNNSARTAQAIQAGVVYSGLKEIADRVADTTTIGASLTTVVDLLGDIKLQLTSGQPVNLDPLISELVLLRDAIHRS